MSITTVVCFLCQIFHPCDHFALKTVAMLGYATQRQPSSAREIEEGPSAVGVEAETQACLRRGSP